MGVPSPLIAPSANPLAFKSSEFPTLGGLTEGALDKVCETPSGGEAKKRVLKSNPSTAETKDSNASESGDEKSGSSTDLQSESVESRSVEAGLDAMLDPVPKEAVAEKHVAPASATELFDGKGVMQVDASSLVTSLMQMLCRIRYDANSGMRIEPCTSEDVHVDSEHEVFWCFVQQQLDLTVIITPCTDPSACGIQLDANNAPLFSTEDIVGAPTRPAPGAAVPAWVYGAQWPFCAAPTTLILSDLPKGLYQEDLVEILDKEGFSGFYDFLYVPMDAENSSNLGNAIVNLTRHDYGLALSALVDGRKSWCGTSSSPCNVTWSVSLQGVEQLLEHYQGHTGCRDEVPSDMRPTWFSGGWPHPLPLEKR